MVFQDGLNILLRIILVSLIALAVIRLMGNRAVGQFSPLDFVILVGIGDIVVTVAMNKEETLMHGIAALSALVILQKILSYMALKSPFMRKWLEGTPVTFVKNGRILVDNLKSTNFNIDDLRQELHKKGMDMSNLSEIKVARLESCGDLSIIKNSEYEPLQRKDVENLINSIEDNPLHPLAQKFNKYDQFMEEVHQLVEYIKNNKDNSERNE